MLKLLFFYIIIALKKKQIHQVLGEHHVHTISSTFYKLVGG